LNQWNQIQKVKTLIEQDMFDAAILQRELISSDMSQEPDVVWIDEQLQSSK
jgi:hypothetical protein